MRTVWWMLRWAGKRIRKSKPSWTRVHRALCAQAQKLNNTGCAARRRNHIHHIQERLTDPQTKNCWSTFPWVFSSNIAQHCANVAPGVMENVVPSITCIDSGLLGTHLMVAKNGDRTVCSIVWQHFRVDILVGVGELSQLILQCHGGIVRPENLGGETLHQLRQVLVQWRRLHRAKGVSKTRCKHESWWDCFSDCDSKTHGKSSHRRQKDLQYLITTENVPHWSRNWKKINK